LMELVSSCIFFSQVLSCLTNSSLVFPLITISSSSSEILCSPYCILLDCPSILFCISVLFFFSEVFHIPSHFLFNVGYYQSEFVYLFINRVLCFTVVFIQCCIVSFVCSCAFSNSLVLLSWNFLSVSCTFWLTISSIISIKFS
jgi:hypothetical protein